MANSVQVRENWRAATNGHTRRSGAVAGRTWSYLDAKASAGLVDIKLGFRHRWGMRTTISLDDDIYELASRHAKLRGVSLGKAISSLVRRGFSSPTPTKEEGGLVVFKLPADTPTVGTADVRRIEAEGA